MRPLGIRMVADRVAESCPSLSGAALNRCFMPTPMATGPESGIDAVRQARQRCWRYDWVLDLDVKAYFDSIDWELTLKVVRRHTNCRGCCSHIER